MIKYVIFDLDGTLLNTLTDLANGCNHALTQLGLPAHHEEAYKLFVGNGRDMLVRRALGEHFSEERFAKALALNDTYYSAHGEDFTAPYEGILQMLAHIKDAGIRSAIVSNKPQQFCEVLVPKYFGDLVEFGFGCVDGTPPKPNPARVFEALKQLGAEPEQTLYVGDSGVDMQTACNSNLPACGVLWGFRGADELKENGAQYLIHTVEELEQFIVGDDAVRQGFAVAENG